MYPVPATNGHITHADTRINNKKLYRYIPARVRTNITPSMKRLNPTDVWFAHSARLPKKRHSSYEQTAAVC